MKYLVSLFFLTGLCLLILPMGKDTHVIWAQGLGGVDDPAAALNPSPSRRSLRREPEVSFPTAVPRADATDPTAVPQGQNLPAGPETLPPYEKELVRLAEVLGSVHYLRNLCGADEGHIWRGQMEALLEAEEPGPQWRGRLIASFNQGYRNFERSYRQCTESAVLATDRYMTEGAELAQVTQSRYAN